MYFPRTVVVGSVAPREANEAPQVIPLAVPSSLKRIMSFWPFPGVPERFVVMDVIAVARAVMVKMSVVSVLIVGVAEEVVVALAGPVKRSISAAGITMRTSSAVVWS